MMSRINIKKVNQITTVVKEDRGSFGKVRLQVEGLNLPAVDSTGISLVEIHMDVRAGEVVGIAGVAGNGQDELLAALNGEERCHRASCVMIDGQHVGLLDPNSRRRAGLASVPEKRLGHGAVPDMDLVDNAFMTAFHRMSLIIKGLINYPKTREFADQVIDDKSLVMHALVETIKACKQGLQFFE